MASLSRMIRLSSPIKSRYFSSILHRDYSTQLTYQEPQYFDSPIHDENDPEQILDCLRNAFIHHPNGFFGGTSFPIAISKHKDRKPFHGVPRFLEELKSRSNLQNEEFLSNLIRLYGRTGFINLAIKTFQQAEEMGISLSARTLHHLILCCIRAKRYEEVKMVFLEFPKIYNLKPELFTYNVVLKTLFKTGSSSSCYSILDEMEKNNCKPDTDTFNNIIDGLFKENKLIDVQKVLQIMEKKQDHLDDIDIIYEIRIKSLCRLWRPFEAYSLFEEMLSKGVKPTPETYIHLLKGFCLEHDLTEARMIFRIMPKNESCDDFRALRRFVDILVSAHELDQALEVIQEIKKFTDDSLLWDEVEKDVPEEYAELLKEEEEEMEEETLSEEVSDLSEEEIEETLPPEA